MMSSLVLAAVLGPAASPRDPVAMILEVKGKVTGKRGMTAAVDVSEMDFLHLGDILGTAKDAAARLVFFEDGHAEEVRPATRVRVYARGCIPVRGVLRVKGKELSPELLKALQRMGRGSKLGVGVLRSELPSRELIPGGTPLPGASVLSVRPVLAWRPVKGARSYSVEVLSGNRKTTLWKVVTTRSTLTYAAARPLTRGQSYCWRVKTRLAKGGEVEDLSTFRVVTRAEERQLAAVKALAKSRSAADLLLAAASYEAHKVFDEALPLYERAGRLRPRAANIQATLVHFYSRAGRWTEATEAFKRLLVVRPDAVMPLPDDTKTIKNPPDK
jgi:hypothetical protein